MARNFDAPNGNWTERLNEWIQQSGRGVSANWDYENIGTQGNPSWRVTPIIQDIPISDCAGVGSTQKAARREAAEKLSTWAFEV
ncbi:hypothetical protein FRC06_005243 [Ceratobasidium sp. 370]|nr:hypothetical protein FRC06_005243 [Ceratobasidium sp. 370]